MKFYAQVASSTIKMNRVIIQFTCLLENKLNPFVFNVCYLKMPFRPDRGTFLDSFGRVLIQESKLTLNYFVIAFMRRDVFGLRGTWLAHITINLRRKSHNKLQGGAIAIRTPPTISLLPTLSTYYPPTRCGNPKLIGHVPCARGWASIRCDCFVSITKCITTLPHDK